MAPLGQWQWQWQRTSLRTSMHIALNPIPRALKVPKNWPANAPLSAIQPGGQCRTLPHMLAHHWENNIAAVRQHSRR